MVAYIADFPLCDCKLQHVWCKCDRGMLWLGWLDLFFREKEYLNHTT